MLGGTPACFADGLGDTAVLSKIESLHHERKHVAQLQNQLSERVHGGDGIE